MTNWMPAARLENARRRQEDAMPDTCTISRRTITYTGPGSAGGTWANLATGVACRISAQRNQPTETAIAEIVQGRVWFLLRLAHDQDITREDRVVISSTTYEVVGIIDAGSWMTSKRAALVGVSI